MPTHAQLRAIIAADPLRMRCLAHVRALALPDCWVAAGFVRSAVWDHLHRRGRSALPADIDVIWFDQARCDAAVDAEIEARLRRADASLEWSVKNQARMHLHNGYRPYRTAADAMCHWPETATAIGVRLSEEGEIEVAAPLGLDDLFALIVRPTAAFRGRKRQVYLDRLAAKRWSDTWPDLRIVQG
ncbi:nucleotidyltransferase family protein [Stutzerimonas stutzeri]|nr:nucleotidyltransferase family protein [Stutzerimonas stutzeri]